MNTERLYYNDAYIRDFEATVSECEKQGDRYAVILDKTAFYPEGGGQNADTGTLNDACVLDVQEQGEKVVHFCDKLLEKGEKVSGKIDWERRFSLMQNHSGEHIVAGIIHERYGFDNVGFHMNDSLVTVDFSGLIPTEDIPTIELAANEAVWANIKTEILYPTKEELDALEYRSKKALEGQVRIVRFADVDSCACCGTHVKATGEIGLIRLLSCTKFHDGVRMEMMCGKNAFLYSQELSAQNRQTEILLSAKPLETAAAVQRLSDECDALKGEIAGLENRIFEKTAQSMAENGSHLVFEDGLSSDGVRRLCIVALERTKRLCVAFSGDDENGYKYAVGTEDGDLRDFAKEMNAALDGRGGGKPQFIMGSVKAKKNEIEAFFEERI